MSKPTLLSPWFVVMLFHTDGGMLWYTEEELDNGLTPNVTRDRTEARLFNSLHSAFRVAEANGAYCVVVADEASLKEYRPNGI